MEAMCNISRDEKGGANYIVRSPFVKVRGSKYSCDGRQNQDDSYNPPENAARRNLILNHDGPHQHLVHFQHNLGKLVSAGDSGRLRESPRPASSIEVSRSKSYDDHPSTNNIERYLNMDYLISLRISKASELHPSVLRH
jgi:hypothetical protein